MLLLPTTATHTCNFSFDGGFIDLDLAEELFLKILCDYVTFPRKIRELNNKSDQEKIVLQWFP